MSLNSRSCASVVRSLTTAVVALFCGCAEVQLDVGGSDGRLDCVDDAGCTNALTLRGRVEDQVDGEPIEKAQVVVLDAEGLEIAGPVAVDDQANYEVIIDAAPNETLRLGASAPSYHTKPSNGHPTQSIVLMDEVPDEIDDDRTVIRLVKKGNGNGNDDD